MKVKKITKYILYGCLTVSCFSVDVIKSFANNEAENTAREDEVGKQWVKIFGGSKYDYYNSVVETLDGGLVAVGNSLSTDAGFISKGSNDAVIVKYHSSGNQQWVKNFGGSSSDRYNSVVETSDGGLVAVGDSLSVDAGFISKGNNDAVIVKYDSSGNQQWVKIFGGSKYDYYNSVVETSDGGLVAIGYSDSSDAGFTNIGTYDAVIVKYDSSGNQQWVKNFGGSSNDRYYSVVETSDGGLVAVGYSNSSGAWFANKGGSDAVIVKYDSSGNQQWAKNFGGASSDYYRTVVEVSGGGLVAIGDSSSDDAGFTNKGYNDAIIVEYDSNGKQQWMKSFGGSADDYYHSVVETLDGGLVAVGNSLSTDAGFANKGSVDAIMVKYRTSSLTEKAVKKAEQTKDIRDIEDARDLVNELLESLEKDQLQDRLNAISPNISMDKKNATANLDIYIKSENMLSLSLDTNSVSFDDFSGVEDIEKQNAVNLTVNSSLPYTVKAYLASEIQNADKSKIMDKSILNIKANSESAYETFSDTITPIVLLNNQIEGNNINHGIDLKLKGNIAHEKDVYKTTIKFEVEQK